MRVALLEMLHPDAVPADTPIPAEGAIDEADRDRQGVLRRRRAEVRQRHPRRGAARAARRAARRSRPTARRATSETPLTALRSAASRVLPFDDRPTPHRPTRLRARLRAAAGPQRSRARRPRRADRPAHPPGVRDRRPHGRRRRRHAARAGGRRQRRRDRRRHRRRAAAVRRPAPRRRGLRLRRLRPPPHARPRSAARRRPDRRRRRGPARPGLPDRRPQRAGPPRRDPRRGRRRQRRRPRRRRGRRAHRDASRRSGRSRPSPARPTTSTTRAPSTSSTASATARRSTSRTSTPPRAWRSSAPEPSPGGTTDFGATIAGGRDVDGDGRPDLVVTDEPLPRDRRARRTRRRGPTPT